MVHLHPNSRTSNTVAHAVEGLRLSCVLPRDLKRSGHILTLLQQTEPRINHVGEGLGTTEMCLLEMLTPRVACVFLNGLPACVGKGRILATVWSTVWTQLQKGFHNMAACGSRAPCSHPGGLLQPCMHLGCADLLDALLEPGFAILCLLCLLRSSSMLPDTLGESARASALEELGVCGA